ncbi:MAG: cytochrome P450, partial [Panacagrimonas sp.]
DVATSRQWFRDQIMECVNYFDRLFQERRENPGFDMVSMLAHGPSTKDKSPIEHLGNLILLIVGGNDTTRNSMSGGVLALNQYPEQYRKLCANPALIRSMTSEIIRWQTPLSSMRRTALQDVELGGKQIKKGDKVVMWYVSGNRDSQAIDHPDQFIIDRDNPRYHLSFGFGIHRCVGNRLAEMQLRVLWEEALKRWPDPGQLEVVGEPQRVYSPLIRGYDQLPVRINA